MTRQSGLRGLMLDAARLVESPDYYRRFLDFCAEWNVNAVIFRLTDDQGCALRFRSHPELITHPNALTPEEAQALAAYAAARGIELIPEIESLGHSHYITRAPEHADLDDQAPGGHSWANALIPLHPKTMRILGDLYAEAAALFPGRYLHAGCDETNWGGSAFSRELLKTRSKAQVWGEYLNALNAKVRGLGREMIVWDDMVLQHEPAILDHLDRSIILHDWEYAGGDPAPIAARLALARDKGFRMIGGPALHWCKWGPRVGTTQLANLDAYADVFLKSGASVPLAKESTGDGVGASIGVIATNWCPARHLRDAIWDGLAYAAVAMHEGAAAACASAFQRFVERHYGTEWNETWGGMFTTLYAAAPTRQGDAPVRLLVPWASAEELQQAIAAAPLPPQPFAGLLDALDRLQPAVRRNSADFAAIRLTVSYLAHLYWRQTAVRGLSGDALQAALAEVARRDALLADQLAPDWRATRASDPLTGYAQLAAWGFGPEDWLHGRFLAAARFTGQYLGADDVPDSSGLAACAGGSYFTAPFSYDLSLRVVGANVEMTWTEWPYGGAEKRCLRVIETNVTPRAPSGVVAARHEAWPALTVPGHTVSRSVVAVDGNGVPHLAACVERLVELDGGDVNWHSRIVTASLVDGQWSINGESCIDYAMNPWMAGYAGRRRTPSLAVDPVGGAWVFFEEKLDPHSMSPGLGRLIMRRIGGKPEEVLLSGHSQYHVAEHVLPDGRLAVATLAQHDRYERCPPAYELHLVDPAAPLALRPANLPGNAGARPFCDPLRRPQPRPREGDRQLFFGDLHLHSALSGDLEGDQEELYPLARDVAALDFVAFTENDYAGFTHPQTPAARRQSWENAERWNEPGIFTAFQGWEYTLHRTPIRPAALDSHRCVIFPGSDAPLHSWLEVVDAPELARRLHGQRVLLHHHHPSGYDITDDTVERNIEICSGWWNCMAIPAFVERLHALLNAGLRLGFIGGSDNHERNPGLGGALTGVWATANTREAIFGALAERRCFATTGMRPDLRFTVAGLPMGSCGTVDGTPVIRIAVRNETPVHAIRIVRDGETVHRRQFDAPAVEIEWRDETAADNSRHWYYAHVRFAGEARTLPWNRAPWRGVDAWTSPAWVLNQRRNT